MKPASRKLQACLSAAYVPVKARSAVHSLMTPQPFLRCTACTFTSLGWDWPRNAARCAFVCCYAVLCANFCVVMCVHNQQIAQCQRFHRDVRVHQVAYVRASKQVQES